MFKPVHCELPFSEKKPTKKSSILDSIDIHSMGIGFHLAGTKIIEERIKSGTFCVEDESLTRF